LNRVCSIFSQLLQFFPRMEFEVAVRKHRANRHERGFDCWTQFVAMLFCQLGQAQSLREICGGLAATEGKLRHLGVGRAPKRTTLSYANAHRPAGLYREIFSLLLDKAQRLALSRNKRFRFQNPLVSIDSSIIELSLSMCDWAKYQRQKGAAKLHLVLDHQGFLPSFACVTEGKACDLTPVRHLDYPPGAILIFDRGYQDYRWFDRLTEKDISFVTPLRRHAHCEVLESRPIPVGGDVIQDERIRLGAQRHRMANEMRRVVVRRPDRTRPWVFLTNNFDLPANVIPLIYEQRWAIEVFFRTIKQLMRIKTFVGTSLNAVRIQMWTAMIAILLFKILQMRAKFGWSLSNLVALLRQQLFVHRSLWAWIDEPFQPPPLLDTTPIQQLCLKLG
jgi:transposase